MARIPVVTLVGRTNVGKSTLFNALQGRRVSIVEDQSGVTRDRNYGLINRDGFRFTLIDTGGLFGDNADQGEEGKYKIKDSVRAQTEIAIEESDLVLVIFDGLNGLHPKDGEVVDILRKSGKDVIWVVNKCEKPSTQIAAAEFYSLGLEEFVFISAEHRRGVKELIEKIKERFPEALPETEGEEEPEDSDPAIRIAVLGKPNAGKSTLINRILGEDRLITSEMPGTTRDNIDIRFTKGEQEYLLIDTAGLRKKARVKNVSVERYGNIRTLSALARCDVAVLLLDATQGLPSDQDMKIASLIHERGRGLILVVNKWDAIEKDHKTAKEFKDAVHAVFRFTRYAPVLFVSALSGKRCLSILDKAAVVKANARLRVKTSELNEVLSYAFAKNPPAVFRGEPVKLYFATQIGSAPPVFVLFMNHPRRIDGAYQRYIKNSIRDQYPFEGVDIKLIFRKRTDKSERRGGERARA